MKYEQLSPTEALQAYCDWLLTQQVEDETGTFFNIQNGKGGKSREWYMIFYPLRSLLLAGRLFNRPEYTDAVWKYFDNYVGEQLPNGAFSSNYRNKPTAELSKKEYFELLRCGKLNLADNGSNNQALVQAAMMSGDPERRRRYLEASKRWFEDWTTIWALNNGTYGNGIWVGHKMNGPYTIAMNVCSAFSAYTVATGDRDFIENAEKFALFQCGKWLKDGRPIRMNMYPTPNEDTVIEDYSRIFYVFEAMCWTHFASRNEEVRKTIADTLKLWLFGECGILKQWQKGTGWLHFGPPHFFPAPEGKRSTFFDGILPWQLAKSCAIPHLFSYYLNHIEESAELREYMEEGVRFLSHPLHAYSLGVCTEPEFINGLYSVQATGFAGLSLAEAIEPGIVFKSVQS